MNAGEPPDETGESEVDQSSTDRERDDVASEEVDADSHEDDAASGGDDGDLDPAQEVEAAVEEVMGPGVLDDRDEDGDGGGLVGETGEEEELASGEKEELAGDEDEADAAEPSDDVAGDDSADVGDEPAGEDGDGESEDPAVDEVEDEHRDDVIPVMEDRESYRRVEPEAVDDDPVDGDGIDESAAVQAAKELADVERAGETADGDAGGAPAEPADAADAVDAEEVPDAGGVEEADDVSEPTEDVPADIRKYDRFKKIDGGTYDRANEFLRDRTYITAREWAMARLCADFRTETGVEMTKIGENLPELVPFMTDTYTPQAVNQARAAFEEKVRKAGATFLYGAMCDFFTAEELDDVMYEATEVAKFLLEVEGVELSVEEELAAEDHISEVMRDVREHSAALRHDEVTCPECGHEIGADD